MLLGISAGLRAQSVSTITTTENVTKSSTVYVGEVVLDGVTNMKYLYSVDMSRNEEVIKNLLDALKGLTDADYATLLEALEADAEASGFALCSKAEIAAEADANWSSAGYVGTKYLADTEIKAETSSNLYDADEGFKAKLNAQVETRKTNVDTPVDAEKSIVSHIDARTITDVYYTIEDGQVVRHSDITVIYDSESTSVIYTKAELETKASGVETVSGYEGKARSIGMYSPDGKRLSKPQKGLSIIRMSDGTATKVVSY